MKPIELSQEKKQLLLDKVKEHHPEYSKIEWGRGKWSENQFLWFFKDDILECEIHWFEYYVRYLPYEAIFNKPKR